ncbi:MAG: hypothetical protein R3F20_08475 [Planctomycetota bacterium]
MNTRLPILLVLVALPACLTDEPVEPYQDRPQATYGLSAVGSGRVLPPEWREREGRREAVAAPVLEDLEPLPRDRIAGLRLHLTEDELLELLGEPRRREVLAQDIDRDGDGWNAWVWTWRFADDGLGDLRLARELEVRLARVTTRDVAVGRAPRPEAGWVVTGWELF